MSLYLYIQFSLALYKYKQNERDEHTMRAKFQRVAIEIQRKKTNDKNICYELKLNKSVGR